MQERASGTYQAGSELGDVLVDIHLGWKFTNIIIVIIVFDISVFSHFDSLKETPSFIYSYTLSLEHACDPMFVLTKKRKEHWAKNLHHWIVQYVRLHWVWYFEFSEVFQHWREGALQIARLERRTF